LADGNVNFEIEKSDFGLTLFGRRNGEADSYYWRITQWLFPWFTLIPPFREHALDLERKPNRHLAFGTGIHFCLGHQLARIEGASALKALFGRWPK
jgi:hypothetical protein